jgi:uncharacterized membrane protein YdjX (TVP38/TMEM64 family)
VGALVGGYGAYALGRKGGKEALEKKVSRRKAQRVYDTFGRYGFWSLFVLALMPPPFPYSPFVIAAGVLNYSRRRFFVAVGVARAIRYTALAYLGSRYHQQIFHFFSEYYLPILWAALALAGIAGGIAAFYILRHKMASRSAAVLSPQAADSQTPAGTSRMKIVNRLL